MNYQKEKIDGRRQNRLNRQSFINYVQTLISEDRHGRKINEVYFDDTRSRALYRWTTERGTPDLFSADRWLSYFEVHIDEYFFFCQQQQIPAWAYGEPHWHQQPLAV